MTEFFEVQPPDEARQRWFSQITHQVEVEYIPTHETLGRVTADVIHSAEALPAFQRSMVDGYAVQANSTYGASDSLPTYLRVVGEILMGKEAEITVQKGEAALIHTGGMIPRGADAVVMVEHTQPIDEREIEVLKAAAPGENVLQIGEDVTPNSPILPARHRIKAQDIGAMLAVGWNEHVPVVKRPRVCIFSTGDELVHPLAEKLKLGQIRDINSSTIQALCAGAEAEIMGIVPDDAMELFKALEKALPTADMLVVTAGSSVSARDMTAQVINQLGKPGVVVHGVAARPGKPTILAVVEGKPVIGLPGNPVSAFVMFRLFGVPALAHLMGTPMAIQTKVAARVTVNVPSAAGREDYVPVRLIERNGDGEQWAEPIFGKSNLIFTLVGADGLLKIPLNVTGLREGVWGEVIL